MKLFTLLQMIDSKDVVTQSTTDDDFGWSVAFGNRVEKRCLKYPLLSQGSSATLPGFWRGASDNPSTEEARRLTTQNQDQ